ncbi:histidine phosphatase family protein [Nocardia aurantia]|uniref:2,3-bisphosphoglycerate-dependent phosphoglycerate mutase n=1 Tax=Nocardia aurantia TaxID=2585199 RepID=A0A7K0DNJ6_9NOCA|nr:histidine phosphatase family protein [Nocardia aurantia]MQY26942.1 2,3-bisphosphoglycerate-dependent phosphoglycerate mutase [Nocardia aurantia]
MTGKLILVRHGETEGNVAKILDTRLPGLPLTERGVAQAKSFGASLAAPPRRLFCSEALRARQTASCIEAVTGVPAEVLDGVYEAQVGELEGESSESAHDTFQEIYHAWHLGDLDVRVPGGESGQAVLDRYLPVVDRLRADLLTPAALAAEPAPGDVLLVSHGAAIRLVARAIGGVAPPFTTHNHLDNTETVELLPRYVERDGEPRFDGWECVRWGRYTPPFGGDVEPAVDDPMG